MTTDEKKEQFCPSADGFEVECCNNCMSEVELRWDINKDGFQVYCPVCGERLMLCDACMHRYGDFHDDCDYDSDTGKCRFSRKPEWWRTKDAER